MVLCAIEILCERHEKHKWSDLLKQAAANLFIYLIKQVNFYRNPMVNVCGVIN